MQKFIVKNNELPEDGQYVLAHVTKDNWRDSDDPEGNRYFVVVKFVKGVSEEEREAMPVEYPLKRMYTAADVFGNNQVPYNWQEFGPSSYFGQEVDFWFELPTIQASK